MLHTWLKIVQHRMICLKGTGEGVPLVVNFLEQALKPGILAAGAPLHPHERSSFLSWLLQLLQEIHASRLLKSGLSRRRALMMWSCIKHYRRATQKDQ